MKLSFNIRVGDRIVGQLASAVGLTPDQEVVDATLFDVCREFAFSSSSAEEFSHWYLRSEVLSKYLSPEYSPSREAETTRRFDAAEAACRLANERLVDPWSRASLTQSVWRRARSLVGSVLGTFSWEEFPSSCGFGPGASVGLRRRVAFLQNKWELSTHITEEALPYHSAFLRWADLPQIPDVMSVVDGNRVTTVPKSWKTDRTIAIEPDWNMFYQKGVGRMIRRRLQRFGVLLPDAQDKNRALARLGSWTDSLSTLDLSAASDSISVALCEALLPPDWLKVLMDLRSPCGVGPSGEHVTYAKISSMGNGFTFELETLLFWALTSASCRKGAHDRIAVYGDDIICPRESAESVSATLAEAGFLLNSDKSFVDGPFRESCGGHYWRGRDVTPFYLRSHPTRMNDAVVLRNAIVSWCHRQGLPDVGKFKTVVATIDRAVPKKIWGPYGLDGVLWMPWDRCCPVYEPDFQAFKIHRLAPKNRHVDFSSKDGGLLHALWNGTELHEASYGLSASQKWGVVPSFVCRDQWSQLPVRLA